MKLSLQIFDAGLKPSLSVAELALAGVRPVETLMPSTVVTPLRLEEQMGLVTGWACRTFMSLPVTTTVRCTPWQSGS